MRRRGAMGRRGPGLVGTMARTAVVAGTATVAVKGVSGAMDSHAQAQQQEAQQQQAQQQQAQQSQADMQQMQAQMQEMQAQLAQQQQPVAPPVQAPMAAPDSASVTAQLQQLAQLKESGVLTNEEFQAAKAKILGG
jgi:sortase (surface protein transpeptidase)